MDSRQTRVQGLAGSRASVVRAIAIREMREHLLSVRLVLILATTLALVVLSTLSGISNYRVQVEQYRIAVERGEQNLREATTWSELQLLLVRPPSPLSILNAGFDARDGRVVAVSSSQIPATTQDAPVGTPYLARFGEFDVTTVIVYLLGLLAILLSFDAVSGEREQGTLALSFSNALARWQVFLGKYLGGMAALASSLMMSLAVALIVWLVSGVYLPRAAWPRIGLWFTALLLYLSAMFLIGLLISALTKRAAVSLLVGMVAWFILVIFIPVIAPFAARQLMRSPSSYALVKEMQRLEEELESKASEAKKALGTAPESDGASISLQQGVSMNFYSPEAYEWWLRYYSKRARLEREYGVEVYERIKAYQDQDQAQAELAFRLSSISPIAHLERVTNELTATSRDDIHYFFETARRYRQDLINYYDANHLTASLRWITDDPPGTPSPFPKEEKLDEKALSQETKQVMQLGQTLYAQLLEERKSGQRALPVGDLPRFNYASQSTRQALAKVAPSIIALIVINLFCASGGFIRFRRYDVR